MNPESENDDRSLTEITLDPCKEKLYIIDNNLVSPALKEVILLNENVDFNFPFDSFNNNSGTHENNGNFVLSEKDRESRYSFLPDDGLYNGNHNENQRSLKYKRNGISTSHKNCKSSLPTSTNTSHNFYLKSKIDQSTVLYSSINEPKLLKSSCVNGSKSMNELNYIQEEMSNLNYMEGSQSVENLSFEQERRYSDFSTHTAFNGEDMYEAKINQNKRSYSSYNLIREEYDQNCKDSTKPFIPLIRKKSNSLTNLSFRKPNYSHVQSKVKQYIQERKKHETKERDNYMAKSQSKSLPVTPMKQKMEKFDQDIFLFDEKFFVSLSSLNFDTKESIPEELKKIGYQMQDEDTRLKILGALLSELKEERKYRVDLGSTLNALQLDYDNLLAQYAQAKNTIDDLRLFKNAPPQKFDSSLASGDKQLPGVKKAYSTSNIFSECSSLSIPPQIDHSRSSLNLVKATSSPLIDPDISLSIKLIKDKEKSKQVTARPDFDSHIDDNTNEKSSISSKSSCTPWIESYEYIHQKLSEFIILESNSALQEEERNIILNYIKEKYIELCQSYHLLNEDTVVEFDCRKKLEEIGVSIEALSTKLSIKQKPVKMESDCTTFQTSNLSKLPVNSSHPSGAQSCSKQSRSKSTLSGTDPLDRRAMQPREIDSGYPASDRSAKNGQFPSFDQSDSPANSTYKQEIGLDLFKTEIRKRSFILNLHPNKPSSFPKRHSLPTADYFLATKETERSKELEQCLRACRQSKLGNVSKPNSVAIMDEEYDASGSSDLNDSSEENRKRKPTKKRRSKVYRAVNLSLLNKYDERFIHPHQLKSSQVCEPVLQPMCRKKILGLSQIEKNSKFFKHQVNDLRSKGLARGKTNKQASRVCTSSGHSTPLKAVSREFCNESVDASFSSSFVVSPQSSNTPVTSTPKSKEAFVFSVDCKRCCLQDSESNPRSSPKCKDVKKMKRSLSIPSLHTHESRASAPFIHIEYFNGCDQSHSRSPVSPLCAADQSIKQHSQYIPRRLRNSHELSKDRNAILLDSLDKATSIAEAMRHSSRRILGFLRSNRFSPSKQ